VLAIARRRPVHDALLDMVIAAADVINHAVIMRESWSSA
jgi:hypothetical protein